MEAELRAGKGRVRDDQSCANDLSSFDCLGQGRIGVVHPARVTERPTEPGQSAQKPHIVVRQHGDRTFEQAHRSPAVAPGHPTLGRGDQVLGGPRCELGCPLTDRPKLGQRAIRLLEVIPDDLAELLAPWLEPVGEALVQLGAELLRDPRVRGVADQYVPEAERVRRTAREGG